ncbi:MAG: hypothetical protein QOJ62_1210 [Actinomycetota bacterium]|nr:hypothetical protein [Actinomycetota bacterium]
MTLLGLAGIIAVSLIGPLLAAPRRMRIPVVVGELAVGVVLGTTGLRLVHPRDGVLTFLAQAGFALVMVVAGSQVPINEPGIRTTLRRGALLAAGVGVACVPVAAALAKLAHTHHTALYAVVLASSSAALVLPIVNAERLTGDRTSALLAQVAIADTACIVALPLVADPSRAGRSAVGAVIVLAIAGLAFLTLRELAERNLLVSLRASSIRHTFGLEMRLSLAALFGLAGLAVTVHVPVMLAGFAFGLVLRAIGPPRRLAGQLFAVTEGFLGPIFFVWIGASIDLRALAHHPRLIVLALGLGVGSVVVHALARFAGQPLPLAVLASAQLGIPVAAVAIGGGNGLLQPGEGGALLAGALITIVAAAAAGARARQTAPQAVSARPDDLATAVPPPREPLVRPIAPVDRIGSIGSVGPVGPVEPRVQGAAPPSMRPTPQPASRPPAATGPLSGVPDTSLLEPPPPTRRRRGPTPNPAMKPVVQSNVRVQPAPRANRAADDAVRRASNDRDE